MEVRQGRSAAGLPSENGLIHAIRLPSSAGSFFAAVRCNASQWQAYDKAKAKTRNCGRGRGRQVVPSLWRRPGKVSAGNAPRLIVYIGY